MAPLPLGARILQAGLDANRTPVGFFLVQTGRALFGLYGLRRARRYVRWWVADSEVAGTTSLTRKSADQRKTPLTRELGTHEVRLEGEMSGGGEVHRK